MDYDVALIIVHHYHQPDHGLKGNNGQIGHETQMNLCCCLITAIVGKSLLADNLCVVKMTRYFTFE